MMIGLEKTTVGYGQNILIRDAECQMQRGRLIALIGRNGTGKSTLLRAIAGLNPPQSGCITINGKELGKLSPIEKSRLIAFVNTEKIRIANLRCHDVVALGRAPYTNWIGNIDDKDEQIITQALRWVNMEDYSMRTMDKMSDGECQRVMIARALAQDTPVILLDEPTSFLDLPNRYELCLLLKRLAHEQNKSILFSTHELDIALTLCDDIALIDSPNLLFGTPQQMVSNGAIQRLFKSPNMEFDPTTLTIRSR